MLETLQAENSFGMLGGGQVCRIAASGSDGNAQHHGERCGAGQAQALHLS